MKYYFHRQEIQFPELLSSYQWLCARLVTPLLTHRSYWYCHNDSLRCHQWWQSWHYDNSHGVSEWLNLMTHSPPESCHNANFVITGGTGGCHYDNLWCHQWWQKLASWQLSIFSGRLAQSHQYCVPIHGAYIPPVKSSALSYTEPTYIFVWIFQGHGQLTNWHVRSMIYLAHQLSEFDMMFANKNKLI